MHAGALERGTPLLVDEPGGGIGEVALRIARRLAPLGLEVQRPARAEALEHIACAGAGADQLGLGRALQVGAAEPTSALKTAVLVEHHSRRDQCRPRQVIREPVGRPTIFAQG